MILTWGSSIWAASQSVETSGSSVGGVMDGYSFRTRRGTKLHNAGHDDLRLSLRFLLRLDLFDRTAGIAPGGETAAHMRDRLQPHVLGGFRRQRRSHSSGAMKNEFFVLLKYRVGIWDCRNDPKPQYASRAGERAGNSAGVLDFAGIAA